MFPLPILGGLHAGFHCRTMQATPEKGRHIMTDAAKVILLVEDNPDEVTLSLRALKQSRLTNPIVVARDGVEALDFLFARGAHEARALEPLPMLVMLDLKLPRLDGLGVLKALRADERTRFLPVVILTSSKEEQDLVAGYALGANSYVRKPVDFTEFLSAVKTLGIYWHILNEVPRQEATLSRSMLERR